MIDIAFYPGAKRTIELAKAAGVYEMCIRDRGLVLHVFRIPEQKKQEYWEEEDQTCLLYTSRCV